jgi:spore coat protein H
VAVSTRFVELLQHLLSQWRRQVYGRRLKQSQGCVFQPWHRPVVVGLSLIVSQTHTTIFCEWIILGAIIPYTTHEATLIARQPGSIRGGGDVPVHAGNVACCIVSSKYIHETQRRAGGVSPLSLRVYDNCSATVLTLGPNAPRSLIQGTRHAPRSLIQGTRHAPRSPSMKAVMLTLLLLLTAADAPKDAAALYDPLKVWTVHLTFTADQWKAIEPKRNPPSWRGPQNHVRAAELVTPILMSEGDTNRDGQLTQAELLALGQRWHQAWNKDGKITDVQFRHGFDGLRNPLGSGAIPLVGPEGKRNGVASSLMGIEYNYVHADLEFAGQTLKNVAVRYKGNGTFMEASQSPKKSFKIDLDKFQKGRTFAGIATLNLQNNITDASWMNEVLAYRLYRDAGVPAPRTSYARVYVTVKGQMERKYLGLYSLSENVDSHFVQAHFQPKGDGALFKPVTPLLFADLGADWSAYQQMYDPKSKLSDAHKKAVTDLCHLVTQTDDATLAKQLGEVLDLPQLARFLAVMVYLSDIDGILGPGQNLYLYWHPDTRKFIFIPWDQDRSWGQFAMASQAQRDQLSIKRPWQEPKPFLDRLMKVDAFRTRYLASLKEFSTTLFAPDRIAKQVDELAAAIRPAVQEEPKPSLERFELAVAGKSMAPVQRSGFNSGVVQPIKPFARVRTQSILDQLAGKAEGLTLGTGPFRPPTPARGSGELANVVARPLFRQLATDQQPLTETDVTRGLTHLYATWDAEKTGKLNYTALRRGIEKSLAPAAAGERK